ncbi:MAG: PEP-CTERM sorting domain-containing protein [Rubrivivax sp.]
MFPRALSSLRRLLVAAAVVGFGSSANAAVYHGVWDPAYGAAFAGLGWRGTADYFVPDSCVPAGDALVLNALPLAWGGCGGAATVTNAQVEFYDLSDNSTLNTLNFTSSWLYLNVIGLEYDSGALEQVLTTPSQLMAAGFSAFGVNTSTFFQLIFTLDGPRLAHWNCSSHTYSHAVSVESTTSGSCHLGGFNDNVNFRPEFTITRVPEPASLGLVGVALAAGAGVGIRRRRNAAQ